MKKNDFKKHNLTSANILTQDIIKTIQAKIAYDKNPDFYKQNRLLSNIINHNNINVNFELERDKETKEIKTFVATFDKEKKRQVFLNNRTSKEQKALLEKEEDNYDEIG